MPNCPFIRKMPTSSFNVFHFLFLISLASCSVQKQIANSAKADVLGNKALQTAHVGISIYDPAENKYLYNYQGDKYFVPASNIKIPTCYAAMKYLGDSLVGVRYENLSTSVIIQPSGDPTFLLPEFKKQPVLDFFKKTQNLSLAKDSFFSQFTPLGNGWAWNDYDASYMTERSSFPVFGNVLSFEGSSTKWSFSPAIKGSIVIEDKNIVGATREIDKNIFRVWFHGNNFQRFKVPFKTEEGKTALLILEDVLKKNIDTLNYFLPQTWHIIHSQPTDSLLKPMMHRSDNFFAEQTLLMVSNELLGVMNDEKIIDTILKTDLSDLPQKPRWADGSGLSRYNLFTPQDFVVLLNKMKNEFGMERIKEIFPTGGEGTLSNYYKNEAGLIYGKTGTLSGVVAFSGYLYTKKGKLLIFSTLVNNHRASATDIRRAVEKFLIEVRRKA